ncbi:hypothetical protein CY34DRAFT_808567 [Suillus luteus UH-Slu-Lm8-n1]|uniref:Uncharacterized protein n=1 Tax=Suillus luteus UH-Slu-Lm8-n1 TaxID=930992 RepID=A0A0D0B5Q6_9AGAM|nr:hypothetical protein CY34DRAFT_808567 [Suillus luteus UH-Slu-Lm8-n1]
MTRPGFRYFANGISLVSQWTGIYHKEIDHKENYIGGSCRGHTTSVMCPTSLDHLRNS